MIAVLVERKDENNTSRMSRRSESILLLTVLSVSECSLARLLRLLWWSGPGCSDLGGWLIG